MSFKNGLKIILIFSLVTMNNLYADFNFIEEVEILFYKLFDPADDVHSDANLSLAAEVGGNSAQLAAINTSLTALEQSTNQMVSLMNQIKATPLRLVPLALTQGSLHQYYYTNNGPMFSGAGVANGYGTGGWGVWKLAHGQLQKIPISGAVRSSRSCSNTEVATGMYAQGVLRCSALKPGFQLVNRTIHVGPWGFNKEFRCPNNKALVSWAYPAANYTVTVECAHVAENRRFRF